MRAVDAASAESAVPKEEEPAPESNSRAGVARVLLRVCEQELAQNPDPRRAARLHFEAGIDDVAASVGVAQVDTAIIPMMRRWVRFGFNIPLLLRTFPRSRIAKRPRTVDPF